MSNLKLTLLASAVATLGLAACQTTDTATTSDDNVTYASGTRAAAEAAQSGDTSEVVCRRERVTGRLIAERICMTRGEWAAAEDAGREASDNIERNSTIGNVRGQ